MRRYNALFSFNVISVDKLAYKVLEKRVVEAQLEIFQGF